MDKKHFANKLGKNASENSSLPGSRQIVKERIEDGANEKAALHFLITALSFASISIFPG